MNNYEKNNMKKILILVIAIISIIILSIVKVQSCVFVLIISILIISVSYSIFSSKLNSIEHYSAPDMDDNQYNRNSYNNYQSITTNNPYNDPYIKYNDNYNNTLHDFYTSANHPDNLLKKSYVSVNDLPDKYYRLNIGKQNPKTLIPPVLAPRALDNDVWKDTDTYVRSGINDERSYIDLDTLNGLEEDKILQEKKDDEYILKRRNRIIHPHEITQTTCPDYHTIDNNLVEMFTYENQTNNLKTFKEMNQCTPCSCNLGPMSYLENFNDRKRVSDDNCTVCNYCSKCTKHVKPPGGANWHDPHYNGVHLPKKNPQLYSVIDEDYDGIDDERIHYNTRIQKDMGLPSNLSTSDYERDDRFDKFNRNLHTQSIQPNIFSRHEIIEPINANIGISFNPQFQPIDMEVGPVNASHHTFTRIDPQLARNVSDLSPNRAMENPLRDRWSLKHSAWEAEPGSVRLEDIYDPRFTGYGTGYRSYTDTTTGQVRYYYSDIDAYKRPNFITRSKIDHIDFQSPMGAILPEYNRAIMADNNRKIVEDQFLRDTLDHRENIMESLMRKRNSELWQLRSAPVRKDVPKMY